MTTGDAAIVILNGIGWGLAFMYWRRERRWHDLTIKAIELNRQVLDANQAVVSSLSRASTILLRHGYFDEFVASEGSEVDPNSSQSTVLH